MPRDYREFTVFVACPSDVQEEAKLVAEVVRDLNDMDSQVLRARLEVFNWQSHVVPEIGSDPQDVVNKQMPDYDIFLGVMWARFGTPTPRAGSGIEEEFKQALDRHEKDPSSVRIMFYFKNAPVPRYDIDPAQLQQVDEFRGQIAGSGIYHEFSSADDFKKDLRKHLARQLRRLALGRDEQQEEALEAEEVVDPEELGYFDYLDQASANFGAGKAVMDRMAAAINEVGDKMADRTKDLKEAMAGEQQVTQAVARKLFGEAADDMHVFSEKLEDDVPEFQVALIDGIGATREAVRILPGDKPTRDVNLRKALDDLGGLKDGLDAALDGMEKFLSTIQNLPKMSKEIIRAKKSVGRVLTRVIDAMKGGRSLLRDTIDDVTKKLDSDD